MAANKATKNERERESPASFARRKLVSRMAVTKAIQSGRIRREDDGKILIEQALKDWDANADVGQQRDPSEDWKTARTRREVAEADMAELELQEKLGSMVLIDEVRQSLTGMVKTVRDGILGISRRIAPSLVGMDESKIADALYHELEDALRALTEDNETRGY